MCGYATFVYEVLSYIVPCYHAHTAGKSSPLGTGSTPDSLSNTEVFFQKLWLVPHPTGWKILNSQTKHSSYLMNTLQKYTHSLLGAYFIPVEMYRHIIMCDYVY